MAIRNSKLGGNDFSNGEVLNDFDLDDTNNTIIDAIGNNTSEIAYKTQQVTGWENGGSIAAEKYTSSSGLQGTVDTGNTTSNFDNSSYILGIYDISSGDTTYNPNSFTTPDNAFDSDESTYAYLGDSDGPNYFGKTFSSKYIMSTRVNISVKFYDTSSGDASGNQTILLQTYDGTNWNTIGTIGSGSVYANSHQYSDTYSFNTVININDTIQGIRIMNSVNSSYFKIYTYIYTFEYGNYLSTSNIIHSNNTLSIDNNTNTFALHYEGDIPTNTSVSFDLSDGTNTINLPVDSTTKKTGAVSKGTLTNVPNITITTNLNTTDNSVTPIAKGWGINKL